MRELAETTLSDDLLPDDIIKYKPISPMAVGGLLIGLAAVVVAITAADVGWAFTVVPAVGLLVGLRALGSIRRYDMTGLSTARIGLALSALSLVGGVGYYIYYLKTEAPPEYARIDYEPLKPAGSGPIPPGAESLNGKKVYIKGYVYPTNKTRGITSFILCRDNGDCCFGGKPKLTDMIEVKLKEPLSIDYSTSKRGVGGTFRVEPVKAAGDLGTIVYHLDDVDVLH